MTAQGRAIFYRGKPEIIDRANFDQKCITSKEPTTLGCRINNIKWNGLLGLPVLRPKIYILALENPKYFNERFIVSVHEMLHGAYERLSFKERKGIHKLLDQELAQHPNEPELKIIAQSIQKGETQSYDELHAVLGERFSNLSPELEQHYAQYFDRDKNLKIVEGSPFRKMVAQIYEIAAEREKLSESIENLKIQITLYQNMDDYQTADTLIQQYSEMVDRHNKLVAEIEGYRNDVEQVFPKIFRETMEN